MLEKLFRFSVESLALAASLYPLAFGITPTTVIATILLWLVSRAIIKSWLRSEVPPVILAFLYVLALLGLIGIIQFVVVVSVIIAAFLIRHIVVFKRPVSRGLIVPLKMGLYALMVVALMPFVAIYEAIRLIKYDKIGGAVAVLSPIVVMYSIFFGAPFSILLTAAKFTALPLAIQPQENNPFAWLGIIGYEELIGRPIPLANSFFTLMHGVTRYEFFLNSMSPIMAAFFTILVLLIINMGARWLYSIYKEHGIISSLEGHAWYNATISAFALLTFTGIIQFLIMSFIGIIAYIVWRSWNIHE